MVSSEKADWFGEPIPFQICLIIRELLSPPGYQETNKRHEVGVTPAHPAVLALSVEK